MRKHFLLLFLMALLPLAGWAQTDITGYEITLSTASATYDGTSKTPTVTLTNGVDPDISSANFNVEWFKDGESLGATPELINVSETGYSVKVTPDITHTYGDLAVNTKKFWVLKATPAVTNAPVVAGGAFKAAGYDLVTPEPTVSFGTVKYLVTDNATLPAANAEGWTTDAPHVVKPGTYYVYIKVDEEANWAALAPTGLGNAVITGTDLVAGAGEDYIAPTTVGDFTFDNANHKMINAGTALKNCTMKYKLDAGEWSTVVPQAKDAKDHYTVYWKAEGNLGYNDASGSFNVVISPATPVITAAAAKTVELKYTGLDQELLQNAGSATFGATPTYSIKYSADLPGDWGAVGGAVAKTTKDAVTGKKAGYYQITTLVADGGNYTGAAPVAVVKQIKKASLTVITENKTKVYGEADPTLTVTYTGFQNGENATTAAVTAPALTRAAGNNVGTYKISATEGTASAENYDFVYNTANYGSLEITQKELKDALPFAFTLTDAEKTYTGEALTTTIATATFSGNPMVSPADFTYVTTNNINVGTANVIISGQGNFKGSIIKTFAIVPKPVYIQPKNNSKAYGAAEPAPLADFDLVATPGGEAIAGATLNGTPTFARIAGENVGTYKIYVKAFAAGEGPTGNYTIATDANSGVGKGQILNTPADASDYNLTASFTVNPAGEGLVLKFKNDIDAAKKTKVYGEGNPTWTIDDLDVVSGLVGEDTWTTVKASLSAPAFTLSSELVNDNNKVNVTGLASANYPTVTVQPMDFTVTARPITVTVDPQAITYGDPITAAAAAPGTNWNVTEGSIYGADVLGLTFKTVNDIYTYGVSDDPYAGAIDAEITNTNYALTVAKGALTVSAGGAITLNRTGDMDALIKAYDGKKIAVTLDRDITRTEAWFAMVLPFETTVTELSNKYGYAVVNVLNEDNDDPSVVKFKLHMQTIAANQPFLIKIATAQNDPMNFGAKDIVYAAEPKSEDKAGNKFIGVFKATTLDQSEYLWTMVPAQNKFKKLDAAGTKLSPISAYLETKNNIDSFAPTILIEDFDFNTGATSIKALNTETMKANNVEGWYTLQGVKLDSAPTQKGIYIYNGKKVAVQ